MMKRGFLLSIPILAVAGILVAFWFLYGVHQPPGWQPQLDGYLAYKSRGTSTRITTQSVNHASKPWDLVPDKDFIVYGYSVYYRTDVSFGGYPTGGLPLPEPPVDLYCILLSLPATQSDGSPTHQIVFAAQYRDIYNADWVIKEARSSLSPTEVSQMLARVGCNLSYP